MGLPATDGTRQGTLRGLIPEDLVRFAWLSEIALAPDGRRVAYTVRRPDVARNSYQVDLYLLELSSGSLLRLTTGTGSASSPAWSRDGERLAFVWRTDGETTIRVATREGARLAVWRVGGRVPVHLDWSPDGRHLAFSCWTEVESGSGPRPSPGIPAPTLRIVRRLRYKQDGAGWVQDRFRHIHVLDLASGDICQLTDGECDYGEPRWSWDGAKIAFVAVAREQNTLLGQGQILIHDCQTGETQPLIPDWHGAAVSPQWRRDDRAIAFAGYLGDPPVNRRRFYHVWSYDLESGRAAELTADLDQTVGNYAVADQRAGLTNVTVQWPAGSGPIYFLLSERGATHLFHVDEDGASTRVVGGPVVVFEYSVAGSGPLVYGAAHPASIGELYLLDAGTERRLTDLNPWLRSCRLSPPQEYSYKGLDGALVHAWEIKPLDFDPEKRYPAIVYVHCSMFSWDFSLEFQCLANAGYVVAYFNQRGTTAGYGQEHAMGNYYGKHLREYEEIMLGVDDLVTRPYVDPARLGVTGGSCGGFMTNWIVGHTDRFAVAVTQRSISNLVSKFGTSDNGPEQAVSEGASPPWVDVETLWSSSPLAYVGQMNTPLLILHASEDHRCSVNQAEELFAALRWLGKPVEMVIFLGESHGLSRGGRPGNRIERLKRIRNWFDNHIGERRGR
jgi:dipeptidyl aminopeptidase/acylaminoacyl peptidase